MRARSWRRAIPGRLDDRVRDRIVAETRGNPLALLELPRGMSAAELAGGFALPAAGRSSGPHRGALPAARRRAARATTQRLMLLAAAEPVGDATLVWRAAETLGIETGRGRAGGGRRLLEIGDARPRSAIRWCARRSTGRRRPTTDSACTSALAEATDPRARPRPPRLAPRAGGGRARRGRRRRARALGRPGAGARRASPPRRRSCERAVALTADPARRADARAGRRAGQLPGRRVRRGARRCWPRRRPAPLDELQRARADLLRGQIAFASGRGSDAPPLLLQAAKRLEPLDPTLARETYLDALVRGDVRRPARRTAPSLRGLPRRPGAPAAARAAAPLDLLLDGLALLITDGHAAAAPTLQQALRRRSGDDPGASDVLRWGWLRHGGQRRCGTTTALRAISRAPGPARRATPARSRQLPLAPDRARHWRPRGPATSPAPRRSIAEARERRRRRPGAASRRSRSLRLAALQGREAEASRADRGDDRAGARPEARASRRCYAHWAAAVLYNGLGRYEEALAAAQQAATLERRRRCASRCGRCPSSSRRPRAAGDAELAARRARAARGDDAAPRGTDWALGHRGALAGAAERRRRRRGALPRGDRAARAARSCARSSPARTCSTASGCAARAGASTRASSCGTAHEHVRRDRHGGVRRARPPRAAGHRREGAQAHGRDARRAHRRRRSRSPGSPATGSRTRRSARGCSSARAPSSGTCARCSPSSGSAPAGS